MILPPTEENLAMAAQAIRQGKLIGMPTETVYGIAADATNVAAVRRTFEVKGRPADNPLIVHVASRGRVGDVASCVPVVAERLADEFWPGPLTLVLNKLPSIPDEVTAGLPTVAVRVPSHTLARRLAELASVAISAPSANAFSELSPTRAEDVTAQIAASLEAILDGGPCEFGIESTVVDCTSEPRILRLGAISVAEIERTIGHRVESAINLARPSSPGQYPRHYAPRTPLALVEKISPQAVGLTFGPPEGSGQAQMPSDAAGYAARLYAELHRLDSLGASRIEVEAPPNEPEWAAVWDRLRRAREPG